MKNTKEEFLGHIKERKVLCASISYKDCWDYESDTKECKLHVGYTEEQYNAFVESLDFKYDAGFGGQELFGTIWYKDGTWSTRGEYDGSEWWEYHECPIVPKSLLF